MQSVPATSPVLRFGVVLQTTEAKVLGNLTTQGWISIYFAIENNDDNCFC